MKVKTNVFFNGPHLEEELEEWLNEPHEGRLVNVILTERPDEPQRVIARAVFSTKESELHAELVRKAIEQEGEIAALKMRVADIEAETKHAHEEVGALVSVLLEAHKAVADPLTTDHAKVALVKTALSRCVEGREGQGTVVNLSKLVPFGVMPTLERSPQG